jgi:hypothetical protein
MGAEVAAGWDYGRSGDKAPTILHRLTIVYTKAWSTFHGASALETVWRTSAPSQTLLFGALGSCRLHLVLWQALPFAPSRFAGACPILMPLFAKSLFSSCSFRQQGGESRSQHSQLPLTPGVRVTVMIGGVRLSRPTSSSTHRRTRGGSRLAGPSHDVMQRGSPRLANTLQDRRAPPLWPYQNGTMVLMVRTSPPWAHKSAKTVTNPSEPPVRPLLITAATVAGCVLFRQ